MDAQHLHEPDSACRSHARERGSAAILGKPRETQRFCSFDTRDGHFPRFGQRYARIYDQSHPRCIYAGAVIDIPFESADAVHNTERRDAIHRDISRRLRRVCVDLTAADFLLLVNSMVAMQLKGEARKNRFFAPR